MADIIEFRILKEYAHLLLKPGEGRNNGSNVVVYIPRDDPKFDKVRELTRFVRNKYNDYFFLFYNIQRKYTKKELAEANLFSIVIKTTFEPAAEECGTKYDETVACEICGANRRQIGPLILQKSSIPKKDIARTIAGEIVVSKTFKEVCESYKLKGLSFEQVYSRNKPIDFFQINSGSPKLAMTDKTVAGVDPFDLSESCEGEVYKCPKGHTIGLNLLSELYISSIPQIADFDFFETKQKIGVKRGLLRPEPLYLCSQEFRKMVLAERLKGFDFEIAHIE